jgi:hypothetical protein
MSESKEDREIDPRTRARDEAKARTLLRIATTTAAVGVSLASAGDEGLARWLTVAGLVLLVAGLHRFGRLGADAPLESD